MPFPCFPWLKVIDCLQFELFEFVEKLMGQMPGCVNDRNNPDFICLFKEAVNDPVVENVNFPIPPGFHLRDISTDFGKIQ